MNKSEAGKDTREDGIVSCLIRAYCCYWGWPPYDHMEVGYIPMSCSLCDRGLSCSAPLCICLVVLQYALSFPTRSPTTIIKKTQHSLLMFPPIFIFLGFWKSSSKRAEPSHSISHTWIWSPSHWNALNQGSFLMTKIPKTNWRLRPKTLPFRTPRTN